MINSTTHIDKKRISTLNSFLRGELSAVETYSLAYIQLDGDPSGVLRENRDCHNRRVALLRDEIIEAGGIPDETSGAWGGFAKLVEKGAAVAGKQAIYAALEEGEDHGLKLYRDRDDIDETTAEIISAHLLPAQQRSHDRMSLLKKAS